MRAVRLTPKTVVRSGCGLVFDLMGIDQQSINQGGFNQQTPIVPTVDNGLTFQARLANLFRTVFWCRWGRREDFERNSARRPLISTPIR